ncbi:hypothetical protein [Bosea sp. AS-1]|uniref:hypothetical protein n=1 Tax=Bosea sp. AS-1 TaxID=2015316 RepID=UPI000B78C838|nr:hypothetical protein [Bosea sp. AS-1]
MIKDIFFFPISTDEDLSYVLEFSGLDLSGRNFQVLIKDRASGTIRATLTNGSGITITGTNVLEVAYAKDGMTGWPRGEYTADVVDITGGTHARIMAVRFVLDLPGRLVGGVKDRKAFVTWGNNTAVVTATGAIGPVGPKGVQGDKGWSPAFAAISDGARRVLQVADWVGGAGTKPVVGAYVGATGLVSNIVDAVDIRGPQGTIGNTGNTGAQGDKGWSPVLAVVTDSARRVLQVSDWVGGAGTKPASGDYVGPTGLVSSIASAVDIRGPQGPSGSVTDGDKGDVVVSGAGAAWTIDNDAVSNAKLANMADGTFKGRATAGTGDPEDLTGSQATALLSAVVGDSGSGGTKGLVPAPAAGDAAKFLSGGGSWRAITVGLASDVNTSLRADGKGLFWDAASSTYIHAWAAPKDCTIDLRDLMDEQYGAGAWTQRTGVNIGSDIVPALTIGLDRLRAAYGRGRVLIPPGSWLAKTVIDPAKLSGMTIEGIHSQAGKIISSAAGNLLYCNGAGDFTGGAWRHLTLMREDGFSTNVSAMNLQGDATGQPDQFEVEDIYCTAIGSGFWGSGLVCNGQSRTSPQGLRVVSGRNIQIFKCGAAGGYAVGFFNVVQGDISNLGIYSGTGSLGNNVYVGGGGAANTNTTQLDIRALTVGNELNLTNAVDVTIQGKCVNLVAATSFDFYDLFLNMSGGFIGALGANGRSQFL